MSVPGPSHSRQRAVATNAAAQVRPGWLLGALALLLLAALCCAYISLCLLLIQGQWQLLYRPQDHAGPSKTPADLGFPFSRVSFGPNEAGVSDVSGWWLPAPPRSPLASTTVLYLHSRTGSLSDALPDLVRIHALGCAVLGIDYRGYGTSAATRPSESKMVEDAQRAITYLLDTRHAPKSSIVLWGRDIGATIAAEADERAGFPLVLEEVNQAALVVIRSDPRTHFLPVRLLLRDQLDAAPALQGSDAPKLFLEAEGASESGASARALTSDRTRQLYSLAADPKQMLGVRDDPGIRTFFESARARRSSR